MNRTTSRKLSKFEKKMKVSRFQIERKEKTQKVAIQKRLQQVTKTRDFLIDLYRPPALMKTSYSSQLMILRNVTYFSFKKC